jgi:hypothetical protein
MYKNNDPGCLKVGTARIGKYLGFLFDKISMQHTQNEYKPFCRTSL